MAAAAASPRPSPPTSSFSPPPPYSPSSPPPPHPKNETAATRILFIECPEIQDQPLTVL
jgi:hypothetical protein